MKRKLKILGNGFLKSTIDKIFSKKISSKTHILIACLPKSGSTFLTDVIVGTTGFEFVQFQPIRGTNDHNIDFNVLKISLSKNTVTQLHIKPNESNRLYIKKYNIKVVFLIRDILSSLKSFYNHILNENDKWFMFTVSDNFKEWDIEKQFDFLIDLVVPWYINFLTSWEKEIEKGGLNILKVDYDDFVKNNNEVIGKILDFYNLNDFQNKIKSALENSYSRKKSLRFNDKKAKVDYNFSCSQLKRIENMISYYPELRIKI